MSAPSLADKQRFLALAIAEAARGALDGQGGPFGAVVVKDGAVIASAANAVVANRDPTAHAEVQAIRAACAALGSFQLTGCDIYASCEPCPMCLGAILWARPRAVYYAATRDDAASAGFDDAVFHTALAGGSAEPSSQRAGQPSIIREHVPCEQAGEPFAAYARLANRVRY
jgi:guanine deaminase